MFQRGAKALLTWTSKQRGKGENSRGEPTDRPTSVLHHVRQLTSRCKLLVLKNLKISTNRRKKFTDQQAEGGWVDRKVGLTTLRCRPGQTTLPFSLACMVLSTPPNKIRFQGRGKLFPTIEKPQHCACAEKMKSLAAVSSKLANLASKAEKKQTDRHCAFNHLKQRKRSGTRLTGNVNGSSREIKLLAFSILHMLLYVTGVKVVGLRRRAHKTLTMANIYRYMFAPWSPLLVNPAAIG
ncbi:Homoserine dehydrogenase [Trichinella spiralis]|uniref:Homoserine dehydrogenase n=1 Tax=Trichinella spiralis TaxID=6334 RepID=A0ABR3KKA8_TRISP